MAPRSGFVSGFVGDSNSVPVTVLEGSAYFHDRPIYRFAESVSNRTARLDFRPHEVTICEEQASCLPMVVTGVYRRGGNWRVEGNVTGLDRVIEVDVDADRAAPAIGNRLGLKIERARSFRAEDPPK